jgi:diguanylate cyclase (GGDEF)-like protein
LDDVLISGCPTSMVRTGSNGGVVVSTCVREAGTITAVDERPAATASSGTPDWDLLVDELELLSETDPHTCVARSVSALELARAHGDEDAEMRLSCHAAYAHHVLADDAAALTAATRAETIAQQRGELVWQSRAAVCRALVHHEIGDLDTAIDLLTQALQLRRTAGDDAGTASVLNSLGTVYTGMAQLAPQAAQVLTQARRLWLASGDPDHAAMALTNLATMFVVTSRRLAQENPRGALSAVRHALTIARQAVDEADATGLGRVAIDARLAVVGAHMVGGDLEAAGEALEATRVMLARFPTSRQQIALCSFRGRWLVRTGRLDEAILELCDGLDLCERIGRPGERLELLAALVDAHEGRGDLAAALRSLRELHLLTTQQNDRAADRRADLLSSRLEVERVERSAATERRRAAVLEEHNAQLEHEATHDALTGLANRRALDAALTDWVTTRPHTFACALIDVDHFKRVNDRWSHQVGDQVLARLATILLGALRASDQAARYGGEEFVLLLDGVDAVSATEVCERIRDTVRAHSWHDLLPDAGITISIGVAQHHADEGVTDMLSRADAALYRAKAAGRDRVRSAP